MFVSILLSAYELELFTNCKRKWSFKYVERIRTEQGPAQKLGDEVEKEQLAPYLTEGRTFDFTRDTESGYIAASLVPLLPQPMTAGLELQKKFVIPSPTGKFGFVGYRDLFLPDSSAVPGAQGGVPFVGDFKTTSSFQWSKSEAELRVNMQLVTYAMATMFDAGVKVLDLAWFYAKTKKPYRAKAVHLRVLGDDIAPQFERINQLGHEVSDIKHAGVKTSDLPPNAMFCNAFNRLCEYAHLCNLSPSVVSEGVSRSNMDPSTLAFLQEMKHGKVVSAPSQVSPPSAPADPQLPAWATAPVDPLTLRQSAPSVVMPGQINPPESVLPQAPPVGAATPAEPKKRGRPRKTAETAGPTGNAADGNVSVTSSPAEAPIEPGILHRTRLSLEITVEPGETLAAAASRAFQEFMGALK